MLLLFNVIVIEMYLRVCIDCLNDVIVGLLDQLCNIIAKEIYLYACINCFNDVIVG